jgi:outer membrane protein assembly factor BamB
VWDVDDLLVETIREEGNVARDAKDGSVVRPVSALAGTSSGELYVASLAKVVAVDASTGAVGWERELGAKDPIVQLQLTHNEEWLVAGTKGGVLHVLDRSSRGATLLTIQAGKSLRKIECFRWRGLDLAFATVAERSVWAARLWDLNTGLELPTGEAFQR